MFNMCSHVAKGVRAITSSFYTSTHYQNLAILTPLLRSSLSTTTQTLTQTPKELPFIAEYLISSFGFSPDRALKVSANKNLAPIKSLARPQAVVKFLSDTGLTDDQIEAVVTFQPILLACNVDKTFKPKVRELINGGCSRKLLVQLIRYNPQILCLNDALSRLQFWKDFVGMDDQVLLRIIEKNRLLMICSIDKRILPRINLWKEYGMSNSDIVLLLQQCTSYMITNLNSMRKVLELIEELGIPRGSKKFLNAVKVFVGFHENTIKRKVEFFKTFGWSKEEVCSAFTKHPRILAFSEENVKSKMNFLIGKAGIELSSIASYPAMLGYSLERVLLARYNVLNALRANGLEIKCSFFTACHMSEKRFRENYVVPFEKNVPGLGESYAAAIGGKLPEV